MKRIPCRGRTVALEIWGQEDKEPDIDLQKGGGGGIPKTNKEWSRITELFCAGAFLHPMF